MGFSECFGLGMPMGQALVVGSVFVFGETACGDHDFPKYEDVDCETNSEWSTSTCCRRLDRRFNVVWLSPETEVVSRRRFPAELLGVCVVDLLRSPLRWW